MHPILRIGIAASLLIALPTLGSTTAAAASCGDPMDNAVNYAFCKAGPIVGPPAVLILCGVVPAYREWVFDMPASPFERVWLPELYVCRPA
jgi:hypothetical protein